MAGDSDSKSTLPTNSHYMECYEEPNSNNIKIIVSGLLSYERHRPIRKKYDELYKERSEKYDETYGDNNFYEELSSDFQQVAEDFFKNPMIRRLCIDNEKLQEELLDNFQKADSVTEPADLTCSVLQSLLDTLEYPQLSRDMVTNLEERMNRRRNYDNHKSYGGINTDFQKAAEVFFNNPKISTLCINDNELQKKLLDNFQQAKSLTDLTCNILQSLPGRPDHIYYEKDWLAFFFGLCKNTPEVDSVQQGTSEVDSVQQGTPEGGSVQQGTPEVDSVQQGTSEKGCVQKLTEFGEQLTEFGEQLRELYNQFRDREKDHKTEEQENEDMLEFIKEKIKDKRHVDITSASWGNYDALKVVEMALGYGKEVHWKIDSVANEYYLGRSYYRDKKSFLTELDDFLKTLDTDKTKLLHINVRDQTQGDPAQDQDRPSASYIQAIEQMLIDSLHPERDMEKLREIVNGKLLATYPNRVVNIREGLGDSDPSPTPKCSQLVGDNNDEQSISI